MLTYYIYCVKRIMRDKEKYGEMPPAPQHSSTPERQIKALDPSEGYRNDFQLYLMKLRDRDESIALPSLDIPES